MKNQPALYSGKGKKPAALVRSTAKSKALRAKNTDPLGLLKNNSRLNKRGGNP